MLLVEDNPAIARLYLEFLAKSEFQATHCETGAQALAELGRHAFVVMLLDLQLPDMTGIDILGHLAKHNLDIAVIVITANGSIGTAVEAMRAGASDFLVKPVNSERLLATLRAAIDRRQVGSGAGGGGGANGPSRTGAAAVSAGAAKRRRASDRSSDFIGNSPTMVEIFRKIEIAAQSKAPVFITGESGTGKELAAEAIHRRSPRAGRPFIALNCAALPKDLIESEIFGHVKGAFTGALAEREGAGARADGGTLFFDELCEMEIGLQAKLLRFIQTGSFVKVGGAQVETVDVRFISATNRDPLSEVTAGRLREDLYYRLYVMPLRLPPLRERGTDVIEIARRFLVDYSSEEGRHFTDFTDETLRLLCAYQWPGNVRQLQNIMRQVVLMNDGEWVTPEMLPPPLSDMLVPPATVITEPVGIELGQPATAAAGPANYLLADLERDLIELALEEAGGNVPQAAARLGISPSTLYRKREQLAPAAGRPRSPRDIKPLALAEAETIRAALGASGGNIARAAALLGINPSTLYRKVQSGDLTRDLVAS